MKNGQHPILICIGLATCVAIGTIISITWYAAEMQNTGALGAQRNIARYATDNVFKTILAKIKPMIYWQDAYDNTAVKWNEKWVAYQYGPYTDSLDISGTLIYDETGKLLFVYDKELPQGYDKSDLVEQKAIRALLAAVRATPRNIPPVMKQGMIDIGGRPYFAVAGRIVPEDPKTFLATGSRDVTVVFLQEATAAAYQALQNGFGADDIIVSPSAPNNAAVAFIDLTSIDGTPLTKLWWRPTNPGTAFLGFTTPGVVGVLLLLVIVQFAAMRRWQGMQRELSDAEAKAAAAERENAAKTAFLGTLSHELRTPLNAIIGFCDMLHMEPFGKFGAPQYSDYLTHIRTGGQNLLNSVNDLLLIAQIETKSLAVTAEPADLAVLAFETTALLRPTADAKQVNLRFAIEQEPLWIAHGERELGTIMKRLVENAIKFTNSGGEIGVTVRLTDGMVEFEVRDNGIGISTEDIERLGRPFTQVEGYLARKNGGLGLGLAIVRGVTTIMGGQFHMKSDLGKGTTVWLRLPTAEVQTIAQPARTAAA